MGNSLAEARLESNPLVVPAWKSIVSLGSAVLLALLFLVAGVWKLTEPYEAATRMIQAKVPGQLALFTAVFMGIAETFAAVLLLVPRFRRWGAIVTGILLVAFMIYIGYHYEALRGEECSCFPWIKRAVGPGFFIGDAVMLLMALAAAWWARRSENIRGAVIVLGAIAVFAGASFGVTYARQTGAPAPASIQVDGAAYSLSTGRIYIFFYDPECTHCLDAAKKMAAWKWTSDVTIIGQPTANPQFAKYFLEDTGLTGKMKTASDLEKLREAFPFKNGPFAVAVEHGRQKQSFIQFDASEPEASLRKIGYIQ
jgi:uncharacterized membrane protein YphA (DoxX/SURF4 family)